VLLTGWPGEVELKRGVACRLLPALVAGGRPRHLMRLDSWLWLWGASGSSGARVQGALGIGAPPATHVSAHAGGLQENFRGPGSSTRKRVSTCLSVCLSVFLSVVIVVNEDTTAQACASQPLMAWMAGPCVEMSVL
jgi:hypothetical protein